MFFAESIGMPQNFPAIPCSLKSIKSRQIDACIKELSGSGVIDENQVVYMGENVNRRWVLNILK